MARAHLHVLGPKMCVASSRGLDRYDVPMFVCLASTSPCWNTNMCRPLCVYACRSTSRATVLTLSRHAVFVSRDFIGFRICCSVSILLVRGSIPQRFRVASFWHRVRFVPPLCSGIRYLAGGPLGVPPLCSGLRDLALALRCSTIRYLARSRCSSPSTNCFGWAGMVSSFDPVMLWFVWQSDSC